MGPKIIANAVFLDFGITDAITDKHRKYPESYTIPIKKFKNTYTAPTPQPSHNKHYEKEAIISEIKKNNYSDPKRMIVLTNKLIRMEPNNPKYKILKRQIESRLYSH